MGWIEPRSRIRWGNLIVPFTIAMVVLIVVLISWRAGVTEARHEFVKRCIEGGGQLVPTKTVYFCSYPDGRLEQG